MKIQMKLAEYPREIYAVETALHSFIQQITEADRRRITIETHLDLEIATNPDLKNEQHRKAARAVTLENNPVYAELITLLDKLKGQRAMSEAHLNQLRSEMSIMKLAEQRKIATQLPEGLPALNLPSFAQA
jgi:hypothetical protein